MLSKKQSLYRPDIDGLRAIAVLAVLFFHAGVPGFEGGFIGVDMFFVISGYLITGIILREYQEKTFRFKDFYLRRVRRILPALIVVMFVTLALASWVLTALDFKMLAKNILATVLMIPNISIWQTSGDYFSSSIDSNPVLHLWSLGVEEQFYLLFPLLLYLLLRYARSEWRLLLLIGVLLIAIACAVWSIVFRPTFAFYWLPPRAWELLCGALLATYHMRKILYCNNKILMSFTGLLMVFLAIVSARNNGIYSDFGHQVLAVVGMTLLINCNAGGNDTWVTRFLAWRPLVGIGRISYSLYLWHWPLFSLYAYRLHPRATSHYEITLLLALTFILAYASWRYVETPFRQHARWKTQSVAKLAFAMQAVLGVCALGVLYNNGFPQRFSLLSGAYAAGASDKNVSQKECHVDPYATDYHFPEINNCFIGSQKANATSFLVWGDSHANAMTPVFNVLGQEYGLKGVHTSLFGHAALWGVTSNDNTASQNWMFFNQQQLKTVVNLGIHHVFLVGRWPSYVFSATKFEGSLGRNGIPSRLIKGQKTGIQAFRSGLEDTVTQLQKIGVKVWLVLPVPEMDRIVPRWLALHATKETDVWLNNPYPERAAAILDVFKDLQTTYGVALLDPHSQLCRLDGQCRVAYQGKSVYYDDDHLSASGSLLLGNMLRPAFTAMKQIP